MTNVLEMLGFISKQKLIRKAVELYLREDSNNTCGNTEEDRLKDFYYRCGNANALIFLCAAFGINLIDCVADMRKEKKP